MKDEFSFWPILLAEIARELGPDAAMRLVDVYGGQKIHIPTREGMTDIARRVGPDVCDLLRERYAGAYLSIPTFSRRARRDAVLRQPDMSANMLACQLGITSRRVEQIRAEARQANQNPGQDDLFT